MSVVQSLDIQQQLYALSTFDTYATGDKSDTNDQSSSCHSYKVVAIGCKSTVHILKLTPDGFTDVICTIKLAARGQENFTISDVQWCPSIKTPFSSANDGDSSNSSAGGGNNSRKLAVATSSGTVTVLTIYLNDEDVTSPTMHKLTSSSSHARSSSNSYNAHSASYRIEWESHTSEFTRSVNKISWNFYDRDKLLCASQDGIVKLFDIKTTESAAPGFTSSSTPNTAIESYMLNGAEGCRDVKSSPLNGRIFASIYDNGTLALWSISAKWFQNHGYVTPRTATADLIKPLVKLPGAHAGIGMTIDWHPLCECVLATGGRDKIIKVWDLTSSIHNSNSVVSHSSSGVGPLQTAGSPPATTSGAAHGNAPNLQNIHNQIVKPIYKIYTNTPVNKISWRGCQPYGQLCTAGSSPNGIPIGGLTAEETNTISVLNAMRRSDKYPFGAAAVASSLKYVHHIASSTSVSTVGGGGTISLWNVKSPHLPVCLLTAGKTRTDANSTAPALGGAHYNVDSAIISFEWMDTPFNTPKLVTHDVEQIPGGVAALSAGDQSASNADTQVSLASKPSKPQQMQNKGRTLGPNTNALNALVYSMTESNNEIEKFDYKTEAKSPMMQVYQHIIVITKEGTIVIHDARNGYFPRQHLSNSVCASSTKGDVSAHYRHVTRDNILGLASNEDTKTAPGWYQDAPKEFGMDIQPMKTVHSANGSAGMSNGEIGVHNIAPANLDIIGSVAAFLTRLLFVGKQLHKTAADVAEESSANKTVVPSSMLTLLPGSTLGQLTPARIGRKSRKSVIVGAWYTTILLRYHMLTTQRDYDSNLSAIRSAANPSYMAAVARLINAEDAKSNCNIGRKPARTGWSVAKPAKAIVPVPLPEELDVKSGELPVDHIMLLQDQIRGIDELSVESGVPILVSDPAVIEFFAKYYKCGNRNKSSPMASAPLNLLPDDPTTGGTIQTKRSRDNALLIDICEWNHSVALMAQISSRSSIWSSLLLLLPILIENQPAPEPKPSSSHDKNKNKAKKEVNEREHDKEKEKGIPPSGANCISHPIESMSSQSPLYFTTEILQKLFLELLNEGDVQHFTICYELLCLLDLHTIVCPGIVSETRLREVYLSYINMLHSLQLFAEATALLKYSDDPYLKELSRVGTAMYIACGTCNKELPCDLSPDVNIPPWCSKCKICVNICSICQKPMKGMTMWCPVCSHSAHHECYNQWFNLYNTCPTGCGHHCSVVTFDSTTLKTSPTADI